MTMSMSGKNIHTSEEKPITSLPYRTLNMYVLCGLRHNKRKTNAAYNN